MFFTIFLIFALTFIIYKLKFTPKNLPPGPWQNHIPFVGFLPFLNAKKPEETFFELSKKFGKIFGLKMGSIYMVVLADVAVIRETLKREEFIGRAPLPMTFGIFNGYGLICAEGNFWKDQRGLMVKWLRDIGMVKFGLKRETMQNRILEGIDQCVQELHKNSLKILNPVEILTDTVGNIIVDFVFGFKYEWNSEEWKYIKHLQEKGVQLIGVNAGANFLPILSLLPSNKKNLKFILDGMKNQHQIYENLIEKCQNSIENYPDCIMKSFLLEKADREANNHELAGNCSLTQLVHLLADTFGASLDTTICTIRWFLLLISINRDCQLKIYEEIQNYEIKEKIVLEDVENLNYLKAAVAESQRIKTVVPCGIPHSNSEKDSTIEGFFIPKNTMIMPLQYAIHMNENLWTKPEIYDPTRFLDENGKFFTPTNFIPFQVGKRTCIGEELARMFLHLFTANLILNFDVKLANDEKTIDLSGIPGLTLCPPDYELIFEARK